MPASGAWERAARLRVDGVLVPAEWAGAAARALAAGIAPASPYQPDEVTRGLLMDLIWALQVDRGGQRRPPACDPDADGDARDMDPRLLLTYDDAAEQLSVSARTVRRLTAAGELAAVDVGGQPRIHRDDIAAYVTRRRRRGDPTP